MECPTCEVVVFSRMLQHSKVDTNEVKVSSVPTQNSGTPAREAFHQSSRHRRLSYRWYVNSFICTSYLFVFTSVFYGSIVSVVKSACTTRLYGLQTNVCSAHTIFRHTQICASSDVRRSLLFFLENPKHFVGFPLPHSNFRAVHFRKSFFFRGLPMR